MKYALCIPDIVCVQNGFNVMKQESLDSTSCVCSLHIKPFFLCTYIPNISTPRVRADSSYCCTQNFFGAENVSDSDTYLP